MNKVSKKLKSSCFVGWAQRQDKGMCCSRKKQVNIKTSILPQMPNTSLDFKKHLELLADENSEEVHGIRVVPHSVHHIAEFLIF